jgi:hypothetical protein
MSQAAASRPAAPTRRGEGRPRLDFVPLDPAPDESRARGATKPGVARPADHVPVTPAPPADPRLGFWSEDA